MRNYQIMRYLLIVCWIICNMSSGWAVGGGSAYTQRPDDPEAFYFTPENYGFKADGKSDVTDALQEAINQVKREKNFGILFLPEGNYRISKTIQIPSSIRLIGYGKKRPVIYLGADTPGFQTTQNYMIWFTGGLAQEGRKPSDAGAGTFYSAVSNVDFRIDKGNPQAVAIRAHFAQHGFINHCDIRIGSGKAGMYDVGNELEDVRFYGGEYGIISSRTSPGWPMMMVDTYFEGQRKAAVYSKEVGFAIVNMHVKNTPVAFEMAENLADRLHVENSLWENISEAGVRVSVEGNTFSQLNLVNVDCRNVPVLVDYAQSGKKVAGKAKMYRVKEFTYGLVYQDLNDASSFREICEIEPVAKLPVPFGKDLPVLPAMETWVNIRDLGAKGDGETDDTEVFEKAVSLHKNIYVPQGWYRLTRTLKLSPGTKLIGLHPFGTQFLLKESEPAFSGFGMPVPLVESSEGGDDVLNGIGINTGAYNYRAVGCKWMAGTAPCANWLRMFPDSRLTAGASVELVPRLLRSWRPVRIWLGTTSIGVCGLQTMAAGQLRMFGQPVRMLPVGFILAKRRLRDVFMPCLWSIMSVLKPVSIMWPTGKFMLSSLRKKVVKGLIVIWQKCPIVKISKW